MNCTKSPQRNCQSVASGHIQNMSVYFYLLVGYDIYMIFLFNLEYEFPNSTDLLLLITDFQAIG